MYDVMRESQREKDREIGCKARKEEDDIKPSGVEKTETL